MFDSYCLLCIIILSFNTLSIVSNNVYPITLISSSNSPPQLTSKTEEQPLSLEAQAIATIIHPKRKKRIHLLSPMPLVNLARNLYSFITDRVKVIEGTSISISSDIYQDIQNTNKKQNDEYELIMTETNSWLEQSKNKLFKKSKNTEISSDTKLENEISEALALSHQYVSLDDSNWEFLGEN